MSRLSSALREWNRRAKSQRGRLRTRWQAKRLASHGHWLPAPISPGIGYVTDGLDDAVSEACTRLRLTLVDQPKSGYQNKSRGATVRAANGTLCWLKVTGIGTGATAEWLRAGEESADGIRDVPKPSTLKIEDWSAGGTRWRAVLMTLAPSGALAPSPNDFPKADSISDAWIGELKASLHSIGRLPPPRQKFDPKWVSRLLAERFKLNATIRTEEWRTAHGDLQWSNLTAPKLTLLDWESWGAAPRGYDAARLIAFSCASPALVERLRAAFAEEIDTPSGRVTQLFACAEMLAAIESGTFNPLLHQPTEQFALRTLRAHLA